ncbi:uncharacterized protein LOC142503970 isoform X2 [Ascaphus truei]|uniref:uncharacterized protein LOC142503970 isoform X2 n=1 Tax=Ascaphus truei TaxID=8439 RepID=UPI003F5A4BE1
MYTVTARAGQHVSSCTTSNTSCHFADLLCDHEYAVTITSSSDHCNVTRSSALLVKTIPCAPRVLEAYAACENNSGFVSWDVSPNARSYMVRAEGDHTVSYNTTDIVCEIPNMQCGQNYTVAVWAEDGTCTGPVSAVMSLTTVPCVPHSVKSMVMCEQNSLWVSWNASRGATAYSAAAIGSHGHLLTVNTEDTNSLLPSLQCGEVYSLTVIAMNEECKSAESAAVEIRSVPCSPENLRADTHCDSHTALASWNRSAGAVSYFVTATGTLGQSVTCSSADPLCYLGGLDCGSRYNLSVKSWDENCNSTDSSGVRVHTAPCSPRHITATPTCSGHSAAVSWDASAGAAWYLAGFIGQDGDKASCNTTETSCAVSGLNCGQLYNVTVTASDGPCHSVTSNVSLITTAPCVPIDTTARTDCAADLIQVTWSPGRGAESYTVTARGRDGHVRLCNTSGNACHVESVHCGANYNISVTAQNKDCSSDVLVGTVETVPCLPGPVAVQIDCTTNEALVSWQENNTQRPYYTAVTSDLSGAEHSCSSFASPCRIPGLECGREYSFRVYASNRHCNSSHTVVYKTMTAPCSPQALTARVDCENDDAVLSWAAREEAAHYVASVSGNGTTLYCTTTDTSCMFPALQCGRSYNTSVVAVDNKCASVLPSLSSFETVPCQPQGLNSHLDCKSKEALIFWDDSDGARLYDVAIESGDRPGASFVTSNASFVSEELSCGQTYGFTVTAIGGTCNSSRSLTHYRSAAPCPPDIRDAVMQCDTGLLSVSWSRSSGAESYQLSGMGEDGRALVYETPGTEYKLTELECGVSYNVSVVALASPCNSSRGLPAHARAVPCIPQMVEVHFNCARGAIAVSWEKVRGAALYNALAQGREGHAASCITPNTSCDVSPLRCGHTYNITVTAEDDVCSSLESAVYTVKTVSCPLQNVNTRLECADNTGLVTWDASAGAEYYVVTAHGGSVPMTLCNTTGTACALEGLTCGRVYNITTRATDGVCAENYKNTSLRTVPCPPHAVSASYNCRSHGATVTWSESEGAVSYNAVAKSSDGHTAACNTTNNLCIIPSLLCGHTYTVTVTGLDQKCRGIQSTSLEMKTAPCSSSNVLVTMSCNETALTVTWDPADNADSYVVKAVGPTGLNYTCLTASTMCQISDLPCGQMYSVQVSALGLTCSSDPTSPISVHAAPCAPAGVTYTRDCPTNVASIAWIQSAGADEYHVTATATGGLEASCNSTNTSCWLRDLECGQSYNITVVALDQRCSNPSRSPVSMDTAPCLPRNNKVLMECRNNSATFSWERSRGARSYVAVVRENEDLVNSCDTEGTVCTVTNLTCGTIYSFSVSASDGHCNSAFTAPIMSGVVPCPPGQVETSIYHRSVKPQEVEISWDGSPCGEDYMATVTGEIENDPGSLFILDSYWTSYMLFYIPVPCSSSYNVTVTARNLAGESSPSAPISSYTEHNTLTTP